MSMETERRQSFQRHAVLGTSIVLGLVMGALIGANASVVSGVVTAAIVIGFGAVVTVLARRSEAAALLSGRDTDERRSMIQLKASAITGAVLVALVGAGAIIELARGDNAGPFIWLGALSGVVYIVASFYLSKRN